ncbi:nuclear inhibitor of protein phosphatase 1-like [Oppia nitens]|uniref:nuclear inhibitor of protein phosphatase 1-like n=1 Tax=Oppia nitens TaxID=1686743 RepID=UPI0023DCA24A|nr:nuclear inhibitor of protein phosphatase 1-like [Oppia nitens]
MTSDCHYDIPKWAGKPPNGLHLDVLKEGKLFQKLMIDEKRCYLFGRNPTLTDFCIDHASCSRVHSALVYHKHLDRCFLVDLGSTHGSFIGSVRLEANKPTQLPIDSQFHFGASTRIYILREKPNQKGAAVDANGEEVESGLLGLPETETELDNLTEYNTAQNKRISTLGIPDKEIKVPRKRKGNVFFNEEEEVINPEDIDPTVGRFRNLVQTSVIPHKKVRTEASHSMIHYDKTSISQSSHSASELSSHKSNSNPLFSSSLSAKLGIHLPNPAPDVDLNKPLEETYIEEPVIGPLEEYEHNMSEPKKKKYAKESWPGKKPTSLLM